MARHPVRHGVAVGANQRLDGGIWKDIKGFFGIASPSKLMADTIGKPMVQGMALGITKNAGLIDIAMNSLMPSAVNSNVTMDVTRRFTDVTNSRASGHGSLVVALPRGVGRPNNRVE